MGEPVRTVAAAMVVGGEGPDVVGPMRAAWSSALDAPVAVAGTRTSLSAAGVDASDADGCTSLVLDLPPSDDRYVRDPLRVTAWRPFGIKSGPNLQWALALELAARRIDTEWLLLLEPDVAPFGDGLTARIRATVARHPSAWVIGARPHPTLLDRLDPDLHDHLNGVALYRIGDADFRSFLWAVWVPSLLLALQDAPHLAFDCLTATRLQDRLGGGFGEAWRRVRPRFVASDELVNLSGSPSATTTEERAEAPHAGGRHPWLVHSRAATLHPSTWRR